MSASDRLRNLQVLEANDCYDSHVNTVIGVQYALFANSIRFLGTAYHHEKYLADAMSFKLPGCFALTGKSF